MSPAVQYVWFGWHWGLEKSLMLWGHLLLPEEPGQARVPPPPCHPSQLQVKAAKAVKAWPRGPGGQMFLPPAADSLPVSHLHCPFHCQALIGCFQASTLAPSSPCHTCPRSNRTTDVPSSSHPGGPIYKPPAIYLHTSLPHCPYNPLPVSPFLSNPLPLLVSYPPSDPKPVPYYPSNSISCTFMHFNIKLKNPLFVLAYTLHILCLLFQNFTYFAYLLD